ncbi:hypothetical protein AWENTII_005073 [Aspergillus wentii]
MDSGHAHLAVSAASHAAAPVWSLAEPTSETTACKIPAAAMDSAWASPSAAQSVSTPSASVWNEGVSENNTTSKEAVAATFGAQCAATLMC